MTYRAPTCTFSPPLTPSEPRVTTNLFGTLIAEIIMNDTNPSVPHLHGWELRTWPVARLGDATLEARPRYPHLTTEHLREDLHQAGIQILGPVREK